MLSEDVLKDFDTSVKEIRGWWNEDEYDGDRISRLTDDIIKSKFAGWSEQQMITLVMNLPAYLGVDLLKNWAFIYCTKETPISAMFTHLCKVYPDMTQYMKKNLGIHRDKRTG